jgi:AhpC/TSA family
MLDESGKGRGRERSPLYADGRFPHTQAMGRIILPRRAMLSAGVGLLATAGIGCSDDEDCAFDDVDVAGRDANPDGVLYPAGSFGADAGALFPNYSFQGYVDSDTSSLSVVSFADYFDPDRKRHKLLHLMAAAMWCPVCSGQTDEMHLTVPNLRAEGLAVLQLIIDGPSRATAPDRCDMESWIEQKKTSFTVAFDVAAKRIGVVAKFTGIPWNALIDTTTMQVVATLEGRPADYELFVRSGFTAVDAGA